MVNLKVNQDVIKGIDLIIFDRDGTLIDLYHYWVQMVGKRAELICERFNLDINHQGKLMYVMGIDEKNHRIRAEGPVGIKKREIVMQAASDYLHSIGLRGTQSICIGIFEAVDTWSKSNLSSLIKPLEGLYDLLDALVNRACKIAIATTDKTERAWLSINFLGIASKVNFVIGTDGVNRPKPAPDMINVILDNFKIDGINAVMVGDAETDIKMGQNAGLKASIAVCSGITPRERLTQLTDYVVDDISKIKII